MLPSLFISHGSPSLALEPSPARTFLQGLAAALSGRPKAIVIVSAHWIGRVATLNGVHAHGTIHDFNGFQDALYHIDYPAPGAPMLVERIRALLGDHKIESACAPARGLDHGAWVPLRLAWPDAEIPVVQLSLVAGAGVAQHMRIGRALAPLRGESVLIIGSGAFTHNLREWVLRAGGRAAHDEPHWVRDFAGWMHRQLETGDAGALCDYRARAPFARANHPSEEHLMPLFVAYGAGGDAPLATRLHRSSDHGVMRMDAYAFAGSAMEAAD